jgi:hypothetical protein
MPKALPPRVYLFVLKSIPRGEFRSTITKREEEKDWCSRYELVVCFSSYPHNKDAPVGTFGLGP